MSNAYIFGMFSRVLTLLAILAIAVVTTIVAAHPARIDGLQAGHAAHLGTMMHASADADPLCEGSQQCGSADEAMCEFVCAGPSIYLSMPGAEAERAFGSADNDFPAEAIHASRAPGLNERPPKHRLL